MAVVDWDFCAELCKPLVVVVPADRWMLLLLLLAAGVCSDRVMTRRGISNAKESPRALLLLETSKARRHRKEPVRKDLVELGSPRVLWDANRAEIRACMVGEWWS